MERMTRNDAAAYLGVDPQTITNWVNKGLLGGYNDKSSKRFWVNADDVKKYSEKYKMLSVSEDLLDRERKELLSSERKVNAKIQMLMHDALNVSSFSYDKIGGSLCTLLELTSQGGMREKKIMQAFFNGDRISNIAYEFGLSRERVRQIVIKAIRKFNYAIEELADLKQENNSLKASNPQPIGFSGILLAKRQNSFYCTYFLHNRNVADTKSPYPIKRLEVIRWFNQKSMVFNQSLS